MTGTLDQDSVSVQAAEPTLRTVEIEDPTNLYVIHPVSARLVPIFARLGVTPNMVSLTGMVSGLVAGCFYAFAPRPDCVVAGFALMLVWHVMDGADGQLARRTGNFSDFGKVVDGICDYVVFAAVYVGLGVAAASRLGDWVWIVVALSGICHAVQSAAYEMQRQNYNHLGWERQSAALPGPAVLNPGAGWHRRLSARLHLFYARVQMRSAGDAATFHARFAVVLACHPRRQAALRSAYRVRFAPMIRRWGILCANYRTLGLFVGALLLPMAYFVFEIVGFSAILALLLRAQRKRQDAFLREIEEE